MDDHFAAGSSNPGATRLPSLLIADDDPVVLSMISTQLAGSFDIVASARDAEEAIVRGVEHQPDVAIIDVQMPRGRGPTRGSGTARAHAGDGDRRVLRR
jgi:CheY-like chemotaxis protein